MIEIVKIPFEGEYIKQGDTILETVVSSAEFPDLTTSTIKMQLFCGHVRVLSVSNGNGITVNSATEFVIDEISATENDLPVGTSKGDLEITDANGVKKTYFNLELTIIKERTL